MRNSNRQDNPGHFGMTVQERGGEDAGSGRGIWAGLTGRGLGGQTEVLTCLWAGGEDPVRAVLAAGVGMEGKLEEGRPGVQ